MNPNAYYVKLDTSMPKKHYRIEMLRAGYDKHNRWTLVAKADRATAERVARDGFGGGVAVRIVEA